MTVWKRSISKAEPRVFLVVQWLSLCLSNARNVDSVPGGGTKILHSVQQKKKSMQKNVMISVYT